MDDLGVPLFSETSIYRYCPFKQPVSFFNGKYDVFFSWLYWDKVFLGIDWQAVKRHTSK